MSESERGFTLVELLVAMAAASLLVMTLVAVTQGLTLRTRAPDPATTARAELRAGGAVARLVERAVPSAMQEDFAASESLARFPAQIDGRPYRAVLEVREAEGGSRLVAALEDNGARKAGSEELLLEGARAIRIDARETEASNGVRRLAGVSITVTPRQGEPYVLVAAARIDALPGCRFDPISLECRVS